MTKEKQSLNVCSTLSKEDLCRLDKLQKQMGALSRSEVLRRVISKEFETMASKTSDVPLNKPVTTSTEPPKA